MKRVRKCRDCVYARPNNSLACIIFFQRWAMTECGHPSAEKGLKHDLSQAYKGVVVEVTKRRLCSLHRQDFRGGGMDCGPDAQFFTPKKWRERCK